MTIGPESSPDKNGYTDSGEDQTHMSHSEVMELLQKLRDKGHRGSLTNPKTVYCECKPAGLHGMCTRFCTNVTSGPKF